MVWKKISPSILTEVFIQPAKRFKKSMHQMELVSLVNLRYGYSLLNSVFMVILGFEVKLTHKENHGVLTGI